jgi:hypothetical protein
VVAYQIDDAATMHGVWAMPGSSKTGTETLKRQP